MLVGSGSEHAEVLAPSPGVFAYQDMAVRSLREDELVRVGRRERFGGGAPVCSLLEGVESAGLALAPGAVVNELTVAAPAREDIEVFEGELCVAAQNEVVDPDRLVGVVGDPVPAGGEARMAEGVLADFQWCDSPSGLDHDELRALHARADGLEVDRQPCSRDRELCAAARVDLNAREHERRIARDLQPIQVEGDRHQGSRGSSVDDVAGRHVVRVPTLRNAGLLTGLEVDEPGRR